MRAQGSQDVGRQRLAGWEVCILSPTRDVALLILVACGAGAWAGEPPDAAARAPSAQLAEIEKLIFDFRLPEADTKLQALLSRRGNSRPMLLRILELQGVVAGSRRNGAKAQQVFRTLLTIDPGHELGGSYAPRVTTPFYEAKAWVGRNGHLEVTEAAPTLTQDSVSELAVAVKADPMHLVKAVRLYWRVDNGSWSGSTKSVPNVGVYRFAVSARALDWWAQALDDREAELSEIGSEAQPLSASVPSVPAASDVPVAMPVTTPPAPAGVNDAAAAGAPIGKEAAVAEKANRSSVTAAGVGIAPWAVAGGAVAVAGVGVYFGVNSQNARNILDAAAAGPTDSQGHVIGLTQARAQVLDQRARSYAVVADALFATAGTAAVVAVLVYFVGSRTGSASGAGQP